MNLGNFSSLLISLLIIFYLLFLGKSFLIPLSIAIVAWYLIIAIASIFSSIKINNYQIKHSIAMLASMLSLLTLFLLFMSLINSNIGKVIALAPSYQEKFQIFSYRLMDIAGIDKSLGLNEMLASIDMSALLLSITGVFTTIAGYTTMIIVFTLFLLLEYRLIGKKLKLLFKSKSKYDKFCLTLKNIDKDIKTYIKIKTLTSLATAILGFLVLYFVGVDLAVFWALLMFILNYIPTIGSMVAVFFPIIISLIQFSSLLPFIIVSVLLILIQIIMGNVIEPKFMGKSLNLSPLVIILSLTIWGSIWGVVGMFLCVPIMVITNIILAKFEKTRPIAIMLSATGMIK